MKITVYGTGTSGHQFVITSIENVLLKADIEFNIVEDNDVQNFINNHVKSIPAVQINNEEPISLKQNGEFNQSLRKIIFNILKKVDFGQYPKYLIPIDFSDASQNAFFYGHRLATDNGAITKLLHVYHPRANELLETDVTPISLQNHKQEELDTFAQKVDVEWGSDIMKTAFVDKEFKVGFPAEVILDTIDADKSSLLIVGATGEGGFLKKWFGSVSTLLMNESKIPVLIVPKEASYGGINKIVFTCSDKKKDAENLEEVINFGSKFNAEIHFLHISSHDKSPFDSDFGRQIDEQLPEHKYKIVNIKSDEIAKSILNYSQENNIDIIAMGANRRTFLDSFLHKSITKEMNKISKIPLLILK